MGQPPPDASFALSRVPILCERGRVGTLPLSQKVHIWRYLSIFLKTCRNTCPVCGQPYKHCRCDQSPTTKKSDGIVRVMRDRKHRGGKTVTVIVAFPLHVLTSIFYPLFHVVHFSIRQAGRLLLSLLYLKSSNIIHHIDESRLKTSVQQRDDGKERKVKTPPTIAQLPNVPAVYALYGGQSRALHVAYVGLATKLKSRIMQHLVTRDSSVTTGIHAVSLNPDFVTRVEWWEYFDFV